jgi:hypothetical protein
MPTDTNIKALAEKLKKKFLKHRQNSSDNAPRGIPVLQENRDDTNSESPEQTIKDPGFSGKHIVSGTGYGSSLDGEETQEP